LTLDPGLMYVPNFRGACIDRPPSDSVGVYFSVSGELRSAVTVCMIDHATIVLSIQFNYGRFALIRGEDGIYHLARFEWRYLWRVCRRNRNA